MNQTELLLDTLEYYSGHPERRCYHVAFGCTYSPKSVYKEGVSQGCAIGRHLPPESALELDTLHPSGIGVDRAMDSHPELFPDWLKQHDRRFLMQVQKLHDNSKHWDKSGQLTNVSKWHLENVIETYKLDKASFVKYL